MPEKHALLSASGAARWLECTPSARLEEKFPDNTTEYAREGTLAHALGELTAEYFLNEITENDYENTRDHILRTEDGQTFFNAEMQEHVFGYATFIKNRLQAARTTCPDAFVDLEVQVDFSEWVPGGFGTSDAVLVSDDTMEIIDLKYGKGYRVEAEGNPQIRLYALGALAKYGIFFNIKKVRMTIYQPRLQNIASAEMDVAELVYWAVHHVTPLAKLAETGEGEFRPSEETCKFCKAKARCKARAEKNLELFDESPDPELLTVEEVGKILEKAKDMKAWLKDMEEFVFGTLLEGNTVPGWKLVRGRSVRQLPPEDKVVELMTKAGYDESLLYERSLLTLTELEKSFGKKAVNEILGEFITKPEGKPALAPETDPRAPWSSTDAILKAFDED